METYPKTHLKLAILATAALLVGISALPESDHAEIERVPVSLSIEPEEIVALTPAPAEAVAVAEPLPQTSDHQLREITIKRGDSLSAIFKRAGLSAVELQRVMELGNSVAVLKKIIPGKSLVFELDSDNKLVSLTYEDNPLRHLVVNRQPDGYKAYWQEAEAETIVSFTSANITEDQPSLYQAGKAAGLSDTMIMNLAQIFQWDISFALDLRQGDAFTVLYEDIYVDGEKVKEGKILGAQFTNMGKSYQAVRYVDSTGRDSYYTPEGASLRKAFLRDPVHFSHVSSRFNMKRMHPIHNRVMPHRGIDYAANKGTPVFASGDGKVTIVRQNEASGRYVVIQHGEQYTTKYLHLSAFARGLRTGKSVKQGQVIGYVGDTGWATAPHLHYEFLVNGVHRNPRTVALPKAQPISASEMARFRATTQTTLARLKDVSGQTRYALAEGE
ncbi:MAG: peptidoglycan DD-metalloendopeptidase family protein [Pseudomonadales bacterium]|nr:peptidoglycan DD-metalloendopeptidase family protein [Pseudomonadales bacterium]